jgi:hypothetical protein
MRDIEASYEATARLAAELASAGLLVRLPPLIVRPDVSVRERYNDGGADLWLGPYPLQVKVKFGYEFDDADDAARRYGWRTLIFDSDEGRRSLSIEPAAYIVLDARTTGRIIVPASSRPRWSVSNRMDTTRGRVRAFWECPLSATWTMRRFVERAKRLSQGILL